MSFDPLILFGWCEVGAHTSMESEKRMLALM
jgi:hypothetical protein